MLEKNEYKEFIHSIKTQIQQSQIKAHIKVNSEMLKLYWSIGKSIVEKQEKSSWGDKIIDTISNDIKKEFPNMSGFSTTNIKFMRKWYSFYRDVIKEDTIGSQVVNQLENEISPQAVDLIFNIPWGHNRLLVTKCKTLSEALFYVTHIVENGLSRNVLIHEIESDLYLRKGSSLSNFSEKLPDAQSDLAIQTLKDPYNFDFLNLTSRHNEKELEDALVDNMTNFLLELGQGFSFLGRQYLLKVSSKEFKIDLLFYHVKLHCYVVIELKTGDFKPEYTGKLNFYISAVDGELKSEFDNPTIGILICRSKDDTIVEYALNNVKSPIGISEYNYTQILPEEFKSSLPSIEQIESELEDIE